MAKEISKLRENETPEEKETRLNKAKRNRFFVVLGINILLVAVIVFQIIWWII